MIKKFKCPLCGKFYISVPAIYDHLMLKHKKEIPKGIEVDQFYYDSTHHGKRSVCVVCGGYTKWNPRTHKYHRICGKQSCKDQVRKEFKERMLKRYNSYNLAVDPNHQRKMLAGRRISGEFHWKDGGVTEYTGTYEKDFLRVCEDLLHLQSSDVIGPSPHQYLYRYNNQDHFYIPDFYFPDLDLEIEIKDGGSNPNMHHKIQEVDKFKEENKDLVMLKQNKVHYIKILNKNYTHFIPVFNRIREGDLSTGEKKNKIKILM